MKNTITQSDIDNLIGHSQISTMTLFNKCTIVSLQLPNGFIITESSSCVDPVNYDKNLGEQICIERIKNKLWELEGYRLQCALYEGGNKNA